MILDIASGLGRYENRDTPCSPPMSMRRSPKPSILPRRGYRVEMLFIRSRRISSVERPIIPWRSISLIDVRTIEVALRFNIFIPSLTPDRTTIAISIYATKGGADGADMTTPSDMAIHAINTTRGHPKYAQCGLTSRTTTSPSAKPRTGYAINTYYHLRAMTALGFNYREKVSLYGSG
jgi:hypothetical protein